MMTEETAATEAPASRRGRPRPQATIDRDARVLEHMRAVDGGLTKAQLADATGLTGNEVYLSLYRLKRDGHVERVRGEDQRHVWRVVAAA
jgi:hypothetical protein